MPTADQQFELATSDIELSDAALESLASLLVDWATAEQTNTEAPAA